MTTAGTSTVTALQAALATEHEVIYGYGVAGAHLHGPARRAVLRRLDVHAARRDRIASLLRAAGGAPAPGRPAYALPFPVTDPTAAARLATRLEDAVAGAAWDVTAAARPDSAGRRLGVDMLADAAGWAARWRAASGDTEVPALPGQPS